MSVIKLTDLDLKGKRVLIRADLNVPVKDGKVTSDARITASMPTFEHCIKAGAKVMVMSHLGRPTEGEYQRREFAQTCGRRSVHEARQTGAPHQGLDQRRLRRRRRRAGAARERALQQGREEERRRNRAEIRQAVRRVRDGRVRHRAPRRGFDPRRRQVRAGRLRRHPAHRRTGGADQGAAQSEAADGGDRRRLQGFDQAHRARVAVRESRPARGRRRHRQHLPRRFRKENRQVAGRGRPHPDREDAHGEDDQARRDDSDRGRRGRAARSSTPTSRRC